MPLKIVSDPQTGEQLTYIIPYTFATARPAAIPRLNPDEKDQILEAAKALRTKESSSLTTVINLDPEENPEVICLKLRTHKSKLAKKLLEIFTDYPYLLSETNRKKTKDCYTALSMYNGLRNIDEFTLHLFKIPPSLGQKIVDAKLDIKEFITQLLEAFPSIYEAGAFHHCASFISHALDKTPPPKTIEKLIEAISQQPKLETKHPLNFNEALGELYDLLQQNRRNRWTQGFAQHGKSYIAIAAYCEQSALFRQKLLTFPEHIFDLPTAALLAEMDCDPKAMAAVEKTKHLWPCGLTGNHYRYFQITIGENEDEQRALETNLQKIPPLLRTVRLISALTQRHSLSESLNRFARLQQTIGDKCRASSFNRFFLFIALEAANIDPQSIFSIEIPLDFSTQDIGQIVEKILTKRTPEKPLPQSFGEKCLQESIASEKFKDRSRLDQHEEHVLSKLLKTLESISNEIPITHHVGAQLLSTFWLIWFECRKSGHNAAKLLGDITFLLQTGTPHYKLIENCYDKDDSTRPDLYRLEEFIIKTEQETAKKYTATPAEIAKNTQTRITLVLSS